LFTPAGFFPGSPEAVFAKPAVQLAAFNPYLSLAAISPSSALAAKSPTLALFNPAINPRAALLQFNPGAAPTLALTGDYYPPPLWWGKGAAKPPYAKGFRKVW